MKTTIRNNGRTHEVRGILVPLNKCLFILELDSTIQYK